VFDALATAHTSKILTARVVPIHRPLAERVRAADNGLRLQRCSKKFRHIPNVENFYSARMKKWS
jgi:hypothetical protein